MLLDDGAPDTTFEFLEDFFALARDSLKPRVRHAREYFVELKKSLAPGQRQLFDIRIHHFPLTASAFVLDRRERKSGLLVDNKWYGAGREKSFGVEFAGEIEEGSLFDTLVKSFEKIAEQATPI